MLILGLFIVGSVLGAYMLLVEPFRIKIVEREVVTSKWAGNKEIRIALIADIHAIWPWMSAGHVARIVKKTNEQKPDLILMLGDYVSTHPFGVQIEPHKGIAPYEKLKSPCGVFAVIGNHDMYGRGSDGWPEALRDSKVPVLENDAVKIDCDGSSFWIAGLEDLWWQKADVKKTLAQVKDNNPVVFMMHNPDSFVDVPPSVALSVAGHTHAGQIRFPFIGSLERVMPSKYGKRFGYGHIKEDGKDLVVSGGLGTTGIPLRLLNPPEIVIVTLKSDK